MSNIITKQYHENVEYFVPWTSWEESDFVIVPVIRSGANADIEFVEDKYRLKSSKANEIKEIVDDWKIPVLNVWWGGYVINFYMYLTKTDESDNAYTFRQIPEVKEQAELRTWDELVKYWLSVVEYFEIYIEFTSWGVYEQTKSYAENKQYYVNSPAKKAGTQSFTPTLGVYAWWMYIDTSTNKVYVNNWQARKEITFAN